MIRCWIGFMIGIAAVFVFLGFGIYAALAAVFYQDQDKDETEHTL